MEIRMHVTVIHLHIRIRLPKEDILSAPLALI